MAFGTLEVLLVGAKGLDNTDFLNKIDPYVILTYHDQQHKSSVKSEAGSKPEWNETFLFTVVDEVSELHLKILDKDSITDEDFVGEATIKLEPVFLNGIVPPAAYDVVKGKKHHGDIIVGLSFFPEPNPSCDF